MLKKLSPISLAVSLTGIFLMTGGALAYRFGILNLSTSIMLVKTSGYVSSGAVVLAVAALAINFRRPLLPLVALAGGLLIACSLMNIEHRAGRLPRIHDITTDGDNPPQFVALKELREKSPNGDAYGGLEIFRQQREAYPDILPRIVMQAKAEAFAHAAAAARDMGWEIAAEDPAAGRIEATDTSFWFGFKDDVVIRVQSAAAGTRVDVRSVSRVGQSDIGKNAERIRKYLARLGGP